MKRTGVLCVLFGDIDVTQPIDWRALNYIQWSNVADALTERGIEQAQCPVCSRWLWPSEPCGNCLGDR